MDRCPHLVFCACTLTLVTASGPAPRGAEPDWLIVPGRRAGAVQVTSTRDQLIRAYGAQAVQAERIELGEGETAPGTVLFATDSLRRLEVLWHDTVAYARPARLVLRGTRSQWYLAAGISLGTTLHDLERLNGREFVLAGFGWDYGGAILDWRGGALARELPGVMLYLDPGPGVYETQAYGAVLGDRDYRSSLPAMQALDPRVFQINIDFEQR
jgi:hypothetical protein